MIGLVIVSHSARLAEGVHELVDQVAGGHLRVATAGGTDDPVNPFGTDTFKVMSAIAAVDSPEGVLVLMDLGSAVLSAETALDLLDESMRSRVRLCGAPLVEGAVAAASQIMAGASLDQVAHEAQVALAAKSSHLETVPAQSQPPQPPLAPPSAKAEIIVPNRLGLHARPAAQLVRMVGGFQAQVMLRNATAGSDFVPAGSISQVLGLGLRQGQTVALIASGPQARQAVEALATLVASGFGEGEGTPGAIGAPAQPAPLAAAAGRLTGLPAAPGIAIGPLVHLRPQPISVERRTADDPNAECQRLLAAIAGARDEINQQRSWTSANARAADAALFDAHLLLLDDPALLADVEQRIRGDHASAETAWQAAASAMAGRLQALDDPYLRERAADVDDVGQIVLRRLAGSDARSLGLLQSGIVAAADLTPSAASQLGAGAVKGVCLEMGSPTSHAAILLRAMGVPLVVGIGRSLSALPDGTVIAMDGQAGAVWINPDAATRAELAAQRDAWLAAHQAVFAQRAQPAITRDGRRIAVFANISSAAEAEQAVAAGAEGIGVLRSEILYVDRDQAPSEEEQVRAYSAVAAVLGQRPLVIRTLDAGGDKPLRFVPSAREANPFLGQRGIRASLASPELFKTQLRAILRAGAGHQVAVMFPMLATLDELRAARAALAQAEAELQGEGIAVAEGVRVGVMVEVPAVVASADALAAEVDFFSVGSNDLCQYVMAADRTNAAVASLADAWQPAVLRTIWRAAQSAKAHGIPIALCGELAADPLAVPLLVGMGIDELSVNPVAIPAVKQAIRSIECAAASAIVAEALALDSAAAVRRLLSERFPA